MAQNVQFCHYFCCCCDYYCWLVVSLLIVPFLIISFFRFIHFLHHFVCVCVCAIRWCLFSFYLHLKFKFLQFALVCVCVCARAIQLYWHALVQTNLSFSMLARSLFLFLHHQLKHPKIHAHFPNLKWYNTVDSVTVKKKIY